MSNTIQSKGAATTPLGTSDILAIVQGGVLKRTTVGDLPEGASVITNSNGTAIRFPTGIQVCFHSLAAADLAADGDRSDTWTYPAAFSASPVPMATPSYDGSTSFLRPATVAATNTTTTQTIFRVSNLASDQPITDLRSRVIAIGTWSA